MNRDELLRGVLQAYSAIKAENDDPVVRPVPEDLRLARQKTKLTQFQAGRLVHAAERTWQDWERGVAKMHPGLWELFCLRAGVPTTSVASQQPPC